MRRTRGSRRTEPRRKRRRKREEKNGDQVETSVRQKAEGERRRNQGDRFARRIAWPVRIRSILSRARPGSDGSQTFSAATSLRFASPRLASPRFASLRLLRCPSVAGSISRTQKYTQPHTRTHACIHARNRNANVRTHVTTRIERSASRKRRLYSPPRYLAASTPRPSHRPYLHPPELAESAAIFYFREHILHCDVERSRQVARRRPTRFGRLRRESVGARRRWWDEASCVVGIADEERRPTPRERAR